MMNNVLFIFYDCISFLDIDVLEVDLNPKVLYGKEESVAEKRTMIAARIETAAETET